MGGCIPDGVRVTGVQSSHPNALDLHPAYIAASSVSMPTTENLATGAAPAPSGKGLSH